MAGERDPKMSAILVTHRYSECLRWALDRLRAQTIASELECVIVAPARTAVEGCEEAVRDLCGYQVVEHGVGSAGAAKAAGVRAARAPLVVFMEDHSYPDPGWAEALIKAHERGEFAAVGPVVLNANPATSGSWGCFLVYYGQYMRTLPPQKVRHLPGNQSCYRRELLLEYGPRLADMLQAEIVLHHELLAKGKSLRQEPAAKVRHLNYSRIGPAMREYFLASRVFASERRRPWSRFRRAVYAAGSILLPLIRLKRILAEAHPGGAEGAHLGGRVRTGAADTLRGRRRRDARLCAGAGPRQGILDAVRGGTGQRVHAAGSGGDRTPDSNRGRNLCMISRSSFRLTGGPTVWTGSCWRSRDWTIRVTGSK